MTWEANMARKAKEKEQAPREAAHSERLGEFAKWSMPSDPEGILLEIIAARCLGIKYGDPGPHHHPSVCRECWGDRKVWLGNVWGLQHTGGLFSGCRHECHKDEVWMA